jgi:hypothetical protein
MAPGIGTPPAPSIHRSPSSFIRILRSSSQRGSTLSSVHPHGPRFLSAPHDEQRPAQLSEHSVCIGAASSICSNAISRVSKTDPASSSRLRSSSCSSWSSPRAPRFAAASDHRYRRSYVPLTRSSTGFKQRSHSARVSARKVPLARTLRRSGRTHASSSTRSGSHSASPTDPPPPARSAASKVSDTLMPSGPSCVRSIRIHGPRRKGVIIRRGHSLSTGKPDAFQTLIPVAETVRVLP